MTEEEVQPYLGKPVRVYLDDGKVLAGTLHSYSNTGHSHAHYEVVSDPVQQGGQMVSETIHGAGRINQIEDASNDPAAVE
ncbi:MAG: hypothetical protein JOZ86_09965 [Candidatus Eremiobacteraeota bacterium]|nr:hypothetical protein [Candidatus Eremiobacteraeota bacterium]